MIAILLKLVAAHLIGDFLFQTDELCKMKYSDNLCKKLSGLGFHSAIQALLSYLFIAEWTLWVIPTIIFISHFLIDFIKVEYRRRNLLTLMADQLAHYFVIALLWWYICIKGCDGITEGNLPLSFWAILTSYIAVLAPTSILIKSFIEFEGWILYEPSNTNEPTRQAEEPLQGLPNAGKWIGYLERILILTFIYTGNVEGIGFLLAAKSIFRFGELNKTRDIKVTEYVLIGTLVSFTIAIILGFGVKLLIGA